MKSLRISNFLPYHLSAFKPEVLNQYLGTKINVLNMNILNYLNDAPQTFLRGTAVRTRPSSTCLKVVTYFATLQPRQCAMAWFAFLSLRHLDYKLRSILAALFLLVSICVYIIFLYGSTVRPWFGSVLR